jgi:hypothetical protein
LSPAGYAVADVDPVRMLFGDQSGWIDEATPPMVVTREARRFVAEPLSRVPSLSGITRPFVPGGMNTARSEILKESSRMTKTA